MIASPSVASSGSTTSLGEFVLEQSVRQSAHAHVFQAKDAAGRSIMLKIVPDATDMRAVLSLYFQARQSTLLRHPGLTPVLDIGETGGRHALTMPWVEGRNLWQHTAMRGPLSLEAALSLVADVASTVDALHAAGVVHCNATPDHVLLQDGGRVALIGLGHSFDALATNDFPRNPERHAWAMAPEVRTDRSAATPAADVYSLAALMLTSLAGLPPSAEPGVDAVSRWFDSAELDCDAADKLRLSELLRRCLSRNASIRPQSTWRLVDAACAAVGRDVAEFWPGRPLADVAAATAGGPTSWFLMRGGRTEPRRILRGSWQAIVRMLLRKQLTGRALATPKLGAEFRPLADIESFARVLQLAA